eukprot:gene10546-57194_t
MGDGAALQQQQLMVDSYKVEEGRGDPARAPPPATATSLK